MIVKSVKDKIVWIWMEHVDLRGKQVVSGEVDFYSTFYENATRFMI